MPKTKVIEEAVIRHLAHYVDAMAIPTMSQEDYRDFLRNIASGFPYTRALHMVVDKKETTTPIVTTPIAQSETLEDSNNNKSQQQ